MVARKTLGTLENDDLRRCHVWLAVDVEGYDTELEPLPIDPVPSTAGEVWCLCDVVFANGTKHHGSAMCRGDSSDGPLAWSVWTHDEETLRVMLPPAPQFVLDKEGPKLLARKFGVAVEEVFPLTLQVVPRFETPPAVRAVTLDVSGVLRRGVDAC